MDDAKQWKLKVSMGKVEALLWNFYPGMYEDS